MSEVITDAGGDFCSARLNFDSTDTGDSSQLVAVVYSDLGNTASDFSASQWMVDGEGVVYPTTQLSAVPNKSFWLISQKFEVECVVQ